MSSPLRDPAAASPGPPGASQPPGTAWAVGWAVAGWVTAIVASTVAAAAFRAVTGLPEVGQGFKTVPLWGVLLLQLPLWGTLAGVAWLSSRHHGTGSLGADLGLRVRWADVPLGLVAGAAVQLLALPALVFVYELVGVDPTALGESARSLADRAGGANVVLLLTIVLVGAPLAEELFYRGLLLRGLQRRLGAGLALVLSSLLFGLAHLRLLELPALAIFGAVTALLALRTGRLGGAIIAHVTFNAIAVANLLSA